MSVQLVVEKGAVAGKAYPLADLTLIGRASECAIVLSDAQVSRQHAEIRRTNQGWQIRDLGSANGTWVNDLRLMRAQPLVPGDRVRVGSTVFVFKGASDHRDRPKREAEKEARPGPGSEVARPPMPAASNNLLYVMLGGFGGGIILIGVIIAIVVSPPTPPPASTPTSTVTALVTPISTPMPTFTNTPTNMPTPSSTFTSTSTNTLTATTMPSATPTSTWTWTPTSTPSITPTSTWTWTPTPSITPTPTWTWTWTPTPSMTPTFTRTWTPTPTAYISFRADRSVLEAGTCATLSWDVENVKQVYLYGGEFGNLPGLPKTGHGSDLACPKAASTLYGLHVIKPDASEIFPTVTIQVVDSQPPIIASVTVTPTQITTLGSTCGNPKSTITTNVTDPSSLLYVNIVYRFESNVRVGWVRVGDSITNSMSSIGGNNYQANIAATEASKDGQRIVLNIEAADVYNHVARSKEYIIQINDCFVVQ